MDDLSVKVSPIQIRTATFSASPEESANIVGWLQDALDAGYNGKFQSNFSSSDIRRLVAGFSAIANNREFGGH